jgi:hypothetical protein
MPRDGSPLGSVRRSICSERAQENPGSLTWSTWYLRRASRRPLLIDGRASGLAHAITVCYGDSRIKRRAVALANLPNLGKVVPARGCGQFGNETGRTSCQPSSVEPMEGFSMSTNRKKLPLTTARKRENPQATRRARAAPACLPVEHAGRLHSSRPRNAG